jgi:hypothetical protein
MRVFRKSLPSDAIREWAPVLRSGYAQIEIPRFARFARIGLKGAAALVYAYSVRKTGAHFLRNTRCLPDISA